MEERILQFRIGAVVICAGAITIILVLVFGDASPFRQLYEVQFDTDTAPGVSEGTPVRKNGILIGRVDKVDQLDNGKVRLGLSIYDGQKIFDGEVFQIGTASLLGDAVVDVVPGEGPRGQPIEDGAFIPNEYVVVKVDPLKAMEQFLDLAKPAEGAIEAVTNAGNSIDETSKEIRNVVTTLKEAMGDETSDLKQFLRDTRAMAAKADKALDNFNNLMGNVNEVLGDEQVKADIKESIRNIPAITEEAKLTVQQAREALKRFDDLGIRIDKNVENIEGLTEALGTDGPEIIRGLRNSMAGVDELVEQITLFSQALNESDGTLHRLMTDPEMYQNLNQTLRNARDISAKLKPIVNDMRIVSETISRDPFRLGLKGALQKGPSNNAKPFIRSTEMNRQYRDW